MAQLNDIDILKNLQEQNMWWVNGNISPSLVPSFKRNLYDKVQHIFFNKIRRFPVLSGARRVGKSTIMFQTIDYLLKSGIDPKRIFFYTLDEFPNDGISIKEAIRVYQKYIYSSDDFFLFVDEAQKDKTWKEYIKKLFDLNKEARIMISGSSSVEITKNSEESGSARFLTINIPTFSFFEFCAINNKIVDLPPLQVFKMHTLPLQEQTDCYMKLAVLYKEFIKYLKIGGFPEYSLSDEYGYVSSLIRDQVVSKAIRQDIPKSYPIRDIDALSSLYAYFCYHSSDIVNVDTIAKTIGIDRTTCNQYIEALERANLIYISEQLDIGGKKILKPKRKVYVSDYGIKCAVTRINDVETNETELGLAVETVSFKHTKDYFISLDDELYSVGYSRNDKGQEIDIVIKEQGQDIQYVEAKYRHQSHIKDTDGIIVRGLKDTPGYIITKDLDDYGLFKRGETSLYRIPALAYFYLLGQNIK